MDGGTLFLVLAKALFNKIYAFVRTELKYLLFELGFFAENRWVKPQARLARKVKRCIARKYFVGEHANCKNISFLSDQRHWKRIWFWQCLVSWLPHHFGRHVFWGACKAAQAPLIWINLCSKPKVSQLHMYLSRFVFFFKKNQVVWFYVSMYDVFLVQKL